MITVTNESMAYRLGKWVREPKTPASTAMGMAERILRAHATGPDPDHLAIRFDALMSHDITYVSIVQTARASGLERFPMPYVFTNCHNSLCAIGGTINADDHRFGLSAARRYGADFVPPNMAVIHQYAREMVAAPGRMVMGSDSHTRYGALGCLGVGEGGGELVKQILGRTWNVDFPEIVAVYLTGAPRPGVGPHDVAIALVTALFADATVKNRVMEFVGPGIRRLPMDFRMGIDVMTTETACLTSVWETDELTRAYLAAHGREEDYVEMHPDEGARYDRLVTVDLSAIRPMIALPFHPSLGVAIEDFNRHPLDYLDEVEARAKKLMGEKYASVPDLRSKVTGGRFRIDQAEISGCCGGLYGNLACVAAMLRGKSVGSGINFAVYPASQPVFQALTESGAVLDMIKAGVTLRTAFCGPCFGAGDVPGQNCFSIRHVTRNFAHREGSKGAAGQISYVALMDARSITATVLNGGFLTPAGEDTPKMPLSYHFDPTIYASCVHHGQGRPDPAARLAVGPNIADWPAIPALPDNLVLEVALALREPVTTTDDFIASGEPSAFRSNPARMAEFTLRAKDPAYVGRAKAVRELELARERSLEDRSALADDAAAILKRAGFGPGDAATTGLGTHDFAFSPDDGSAREQAASCQKVLGGWANIAGAYATKRYRSNCINWGILPLVTRDEASSISLAQGDLVVLRGIRALLEGSGDAIEAVVVHGDERTSLPLLVPDMTREERDILLSGCLINYYR